MVERITEFGDEIDEQNSITDDPDDNELLFHHKVSQVLHDRDGMMLLNWLNT